MANALQIFSRFKFRNRFNIPKKALWLVLGVSFIPFLSFNITGSNLLPSVKLVNGNIFTNIWVIFGVASAFFTGILAFIDYYIRREITITLFGLILIGSVIIDVYYLFVINKNPSADLHYEKKIYFIFLINRLLYGITLYIGTYYYLKIPSKKLRTNQQRNQIIAKTAIFYSITCLLCLLLIANLDTLFNKIFLGRNLRMDLFSLVPLFIYLAWAIFLLPKFLLRFKNVFSKLLILSIIPLCIGQLFMAMSAEIFDHSFNASHFLRSISYIIPLIGIVLNYVETIRNEQRIITKLDIEIKEKKAITESLEERERLLAHSENISHLGSWDYDLKNGILKWSDELYKIYGFTERSFDPTLAIQDNLVAAPYKAKLSKEITFALKNKASFAVEYQIILANGIKKFVLGQGYFLSNDNKLIGTVQDITELKQATLKLRHNENLLKEAEAVSHHGSWEWKLATNEIFWSDEMYNIHGYLPHSILLSPELYLSFLHQHDLAKAKDEMEITIKNKQHFEVNYRIVRPNGDVRFIYTTAKCKYNETDQTYSYIGNSQDVTLLKETERKLKDKVEELNISNKDLEQFAYVASHDLQEPLRKIRAFGERLKTKFNSELPPDGQDYVDRMQSAAERMQILIDDLLTFSRATRTTKDFVKVDLHDLIKQVISDLDYTIETKKAIINLQVNQTIEAVPKQLAQVFQNILSNSLKFTIAGTNPIVKINSTVALGNTLNIPAINNSQTYCIITFSDNGIGFDENYATKIFDLFQRLHSRSAYHGTGIGLAICKKIVENHKGVIIAKGEEGKGASFFIILPVQQS